MYSSTTCSSFRIRARRRSGRTGSRAPTRDRAARRRSRSAGTVESPSRRRLRRRCGTRRPSSRHSRCVRLRFSFQPSSSSRRAPAGSPTADAPREISPQLRPQRRVIVGPRQARDAGSSGAGRRSGTPAAPRGRAGPAASRTAWRRRDGLTSFPSTISLSASISQLLVGDDPLQPARSRASSSFSRFTSSAFIPPYPERDVAQAAAVDGGVGDVRRALDRS